ncbi:unknown [Ruminococcus sp. CAG:254]|nr:unknown [Ruminococcus sp. CAG:254]
MINGAACYLSAIIQTGDCKTGFILFRIAAACHNHTSCTAILPDNRQFCQLLFRNRTHNINQIGFQQRQHNLCFRVAEPTVIFNDLWAIRCQHQAEIQTALERSALCLHRTNGRQEDGFHTSICNFLCIIRVRCNCSHTAGIQTLVLVECPLVIHRGHHRNNGFPVCKGKYRNFRPCQKFFYNNRAAAFAEHLVFHHALDSLFCFFQIGCNDNAFSQSQTICFDDGRELIFLLDVCNGCICIVENFILCGRNVILLHQFLGECLAAFDDCSRLIGAKGCKSSCLHGIDHTQYQRVIRCNKDQINR